MSGLTIGTWAGISEGCPMSYSVSGSNVTHVQLGEGRDSFEMEFDMEAMRKFAELATKAVAEMDAIYEREEAADLAEDPVEDED